MPKIRVLSPQKRENVDTRLLVANNLLLRFSGTMKANASDRATQTQDFKALFAIRWDSFPHPLDWPAPPPSSAVRRLIQVDVVRALNSLPRIFSLRDEEKAIIGVLKPLALWTSPCRRLARFVSLRTRVGLPQIPEGEITEVGSLAVSMSYYRGPYFRFLSLEDTVSE